MKPGKLILLPLVLMVAACAPQPTLEELEFRALQTGDWSTVEKRERAMARRAARQASVPDCAAGQISYCTNQVGERTCHCVSHRQAGLLFGWN